MVPLRSISPSDMDDSPAYAKGKLARELREVLAKLEQAELLPANLSLLEGIE